jgi:hypothetical protein
MKKTMTLVSVAALTAALTVPAFAQQLPTNNTVSGGQGAAVVNGQAEIVAATTITTGTAIGAANIVTVVTTAFGDDDTSTSTPVP